MTYAHKKAEVLSDESVVFDVLLTTDNAGALLSIGAIDQAHADRLIAEINNAVNFEVISNPE